MGRGLVEHDDVRGLQEKPGEGDALLLASRQPVATVTDDGVEAVGQRLDEERIWAPARASCISPSVASGRRRAGSPGSSRGTGGRPGSPPDRSRSEAKVGSRTSRPLMRTAPERRRRGAGHEVADRGLARPRGTDERDELARLGARSSHRRAPGSTASGPRPRPTRARRGTPLLPSGS